MDKILDMITRWDGLGQGFFFLLVLLLSLGAFLQLTKLLVILFRGWPPESYQDDAES